jgi:hypothetical protein
LAVLPSWVSSWSFRWLFKQKNILYKFCKNVAIHRSSSCISNGPMGSCRGVKRFCAPSPWRSFNSLNGSNSFASGALWPYILSKFRGWRLELSTLDKLTKNSQTFLQQITFNF